MRWRIKKKIISSKRVDKLEEGKLNNWLGSNFIFLGLNSDNRLIDGSLWKIEETSEEYRKNSFKKSALVMPEKDSHDEVVTNFNDKILKRLFPRLNNTNKMSSEWKDE